MSTPENATLKLQLQDAVARNHVLELRIKELEGELNQARASQGRAAQSNSAVATLGSVKLSPSATPYTPTAKHGARPRHKRTETPQQKFLEHITPIKVYTMGIEPQDDRGLLHDFFEDVRRWAARYTMELNAQCSSIDNVSDLINGKSDIQHLLDDKSMRQDIVAALAIRHIVLHAIGEASMVKSSNPHATECHSIVSQFAMLTPDDYRTKHELCIQQAMLYKQIYAEPGHKEWRTEASDKHTTELLEDLAPFIRTGADPEREHWLGELYVKGYRIGFRLRSDPVKWQVIFPVAGMRFDPHHMVNRTNLVGDPMATWAELNKSPGKYFVRFAITPTISKADFSNGHEKKTVVHSSLVHTGRNDVFSHRDDIQLSPVKYNRNS